MTYRRIVQPNKGVLFLLGFLAFLSALPAAAISFGAYTSPVSGLAELSSFSPKIPEDLCLQSTDFPSVSIQSPDTRDLLWSQTHGGGYPDYFREVVECTGGGFILVGSTKSKGAGTYDIWLVRLNETGELLWDVAFGSPEFDYGYSVTECSGGGFALVGWTYSSGHYWHTLLIRTDAAGNHQWNKTYSGVAYSVVECSGGGFAFSGGGPRLVRTDANGNHLWTRSYSSEGYGGRATDLLEVSGGFVMVGWFEQVGSYTDGWFVQTTSSGSVVLETVVAGAIYDYFYSVTECSDGGYAVAGETRSFGAGESDYWLVRILANGDVAWTRTFGGELFDTAHTVMECNEGGFAIIGETGPSSHGYSSQSYGYAGESIIRTDSDGNFLWNQTFALTGWGGFYDIIQLSGGDFLLAGMSSGDGWLGCVSDLPLWWDENPQDQSVFVGQDFSYDLNASAWEGVDTWWLNGTNYFSISQEGVITNIMTLQLDTIYTVVVHVNESSGYILIAVFSVRLQEVPAEVWPWWGVTAGIIFSVILIALIRFLAWRRTRGEVEVLEPLRRDVPDRPIAEERDNTGVVKRQARPSRFRCIECGEVITGGEATCPECGAKQKQCTVCQQFIGQEELYNQCPHCKQLAHRTHLLEWLKIKGICPYCKEKLRKEELT